MAKILGEEFIMYIENINLLLLKEIIKFVVSTTTKYLLQSPGPASIAEFRHCVKVFPMTDEPISWLIDVIEMSFFHPLKAFVMRRTVISPVWGPEPVFMIG